MTVPLLWASSEQLLATLLRLPSVVEEGLLAIHFQPAGSVPSGCCCPVLSGLVCQHICGRYFCQVVAVLRQFVGAQLAENSSRVHVFRLLVSSKRFSFQAAKTQFGSVFPEKFGFLVNSRGLMCFTCRAYTVEKIPNMAACSLSAF